MLLIFPAPPPHPLVTLTILDTFPGLLQELGSSIDELSESIFSQEHFPRFRATPMAGVMVAKLCFPLC